MTASTSHSPHTLAGPADDSHKLDPFHFPLYGSRLIEASAGTGKTYTIAALYLRLILGHGCPQTAYANGKALTVDQILVVTFTEAATAELRERILKNIHQAYLAFKQKAYGEVPSPHPDPFLQSLLESITDASTAAALLLQAERQMDEAAIFTIHGFCQRMLASHAFDSGYCFNQQILTDEQPLKLQIVQDYWRNYLYPLPRYIAAEIKSWYPSPQDLLAAVSSALDGVALCPSTPLIADTISDIFTAIDQSIVNFKQLWRHIAPEEIMQIIAESDVNKRSYSKKNLPIWLDNIYQWANNSATSFTFSSSLEKFSQSVLNDKTPYGKKVPTHEIFAKTESFLSSPPKLKQHFLTHVVDHCRSHLSDLKRQKQQMSFDDLLSQLADALQDQKGQVLAQQIQQLFPIAMIDEFQDTDPYQYKIFQYIYPTHAEDPAPPQSNGLFIIGDPKQAIYAFRGADIYTYLQAKKQVAAAYSLPINWRSSAHMVTAVNRLFSQLSNPFLFSDIPFRAVQPHEQAEHMYWTLAGKQQAAMTFWTAMPSSDGILKKDQYLDQMAQATAEQIYQILTLSDQQQASFYNKGKSQIIAAEDIAVLVRTGSEGRKIKLALASKGISSVYLSNRDNLFASQMAEQLFHFLSAVLTCESETHIKACLASHLFQISLTELEQLLNQEQQWEMILEEFKFYRSVWLTQGVMSMIRAAINKRDLANKLLCQEQGERHLTDLLHLAEWLQQTSQEFESPFALLRHVQSILSAEYMPSQDIQRLESERKQVQIVTIHKSKGLEYKLVFIPFANAFKPVKLAKYYDASQQAMTIDWQPSSEILQIAEQERLAEDLRLLYVALTRAVYGVFIGTGGWSKSRGKQLQSEIHQSALGYLLQEGAACSHEALLNILEQLAQQQGIGVCVAPQITDTYYQQHIVPNAHLQSAHFTRQLDRRWRVTSYSGLVSDPKHSWEKPIAAESYIHDQLAEPPAIMPINDPAQASDLATETEQVRSVMTFPRGAQAGVFLHTLFEQLPFDQSPMSTAAEQVIQHALQEAGYDLEWLPILQSWIAQVLQAPLTDPERDLPLILNHKKPHQYQVEMAFVLPIERLHAHEFHRIAAAFDPITAALEPLAYSAMQGRLKGFIDLIVEHEGRYYLVDWKSNHLGDQAQCYQSSALEQSIAEHRYDVQYQIYALALHRYLKLRLKNYQYEQHFGGVYYIFLRGISLTTSVHNQQTGVFFTKPPLAMLSQLESQLLDPL